MLGVTLPKITFRISDGTSKTVKAASGSTVMRVAQENGIDIEGACEGSIACSTCHVIVDDKWISMLEPASEEEEDLLDLAVGITSASRLGCQIVIDDNLNGLEVKLPEQTLNMSEL